MKSSPPGAPEPEPGHPHTGTADSLDFGEDDVHVGAGDVLSVHDSAVFAQFGPVLPVQLLPRGLRVPVDGELLKGRQELFHVGTLCHGGKISAEQDEKKNPGSVNQVKKTSEINFV